MIIKNTYCGHIIILGKPNVGKSTLLNSLLDKKVSITSCKPQTTKQYIKGIYSNKNYQSIYIDTPGFNNKTKKIINNIIYSPIDCYDEKKIILLVLGSIKWDIYNDQIIKYLKKIKLPTFLVINKIDKISNKSNLLPFIKFIIQKKKFIDVFIVSAKKKKFIKNIIEKIEKYLPQKNHIFPKNIKTDLSKKILVAEVIREKCMRFFGKEIPYIIEIKIEKFLLKKNQCFIRSIIFVKNNNQKKILIGIKGNKIKKIIYTSNKDIKKIMNVNINLLIWIKVRNKKKG